jgi:hypothetical protein
VRIPNGNLARAFQRALFEFVAFVFIWSLFVFFFGPLFGLVGNSGTQGLLALAGAIYVVLRTLYLERNPL